jgi:hypothetical protein
MYDEDWERPDPREGPPYREAWEHLDHHPVENAPWRKVYGKRQLYIQPMKGDGGYFKVTIYHPDWTVRLKKRFTDLNDAMYEAEAMNHLILGS